MLLAEGKSLREVAAATGRKDTTIRWHLRQIFAKRGIARQAELVRLELRQMPSMLALPQTAGEPP